MADSIWTYRDGVFRDARSTATQTAGSGGFTSTLLPANRTTKIMATGDSITLGMGATIHGGYRLFLWNKLNAAGFNFTTVGHYGSPPYTPYTTSDPYNGSRNSSWGGWTMKSLMNQASNNTTGTSVGDWVTSYTPDIIILMVGRNDINTPSTWVADQNALLDMIYAAKPDVTIILADVIHQRGYNYSPVNDINNQWYQRVAERTAQGKNIIISHTCQAVGTELTSFTLPDVIHPNSNGYRVIAETLFDTFVNN